MLDIYFRHKLLVGFYQVRQEWHKRDGGPEHISSPTLSNFLGLLD